jgi:hypothetical protein
MIWQKKLKYLPTLFAGEQWDHPVVSHPGGWGEELKSRIFSKCYFVRKCYNSGKHFIFGKCQMGLQILVAFMAKIYTV